MSLHFASGIDLRNMSPQIALALLVANECYAEAGEECFVTSLKRDGTWEQVMLHGTGNAVDLSVRRRNGVPIDPAVMTGIIDSINTRIGRAGGGQYDVINEMAPGSSAGWTGAHVHIEFDPK